MPSLKTIAKFAGGVIAVLIVLGLVKKNSDAAKSFLDNFGI